MPASLQAKVPATSLGRTCKGRNSSEEEKEKTNEYDNKLR
jgi:hypothetical protein